MAASSPVPVTGTGNKDISLISEGNRLQRQADS